MLRVLAIKKDDGSFGRLFAHRLAFAGGLPEGESFVVRGIAADFVAFDLSPPLDLAGGRKLSPLGRRRERFRRWGKIRLLAFGGFKRGGAIVRQMAVEHVLPFSVPTRA